MRLCCKRSCSRLINRCLAVGTLCYCNALLLVTLAAGISCCYYLLLLASLAAVSDKFYFESIRLNDLAETRKCIDVAVEVHPLSLLRANVHHA